MTLNPRTTVASPSATAADNGYRTSEGRSAAQVIEDVAELSVAYGNHQANGDGTNPAAVDASRRWRASIHAATDAGTTQFEGLKGIEV